MKLRALLLLILTIFGAAITGLRCAHLLSPVVNISGQAFLEDGGMSNHDGILVKAGEISDYTDPYGNYMLTGNSFGIQELEIRFAKEGYRDTFITLTLYFPLGDTTIYLLPVTLRKFSSDSF